METLCLNFIRVGMNQLDDLVSISQSTFSEAYAHLNTAENMAHYINHNLSDSNLRTELKNNESEFYFVEAKGERVGYLKFNFGLSQNEFKESGGMELERIYVFSKFQGQKIGKSMLSFVQSSGRKRNLKYLWLGVWEINMDAIRFYKANGFRMIGSHVFQMGTDPQTDCIMRMELN